MKLLNASQGVFGVTVVNRQLHSKFRLTGQRVLWRCFVNHECSWFLRSATIAQSRVSRFAISLRSPHGQEVKNKRASDFPALLIGGFITLTSAYWMSAIAV